jgi:hypothetical protein
MFCCVILPQIVYRDREVTPVTRTFSPPPPSGKRVGLGLALERSMDDRTTFVSEIIPQVKFRSNFST